MHAIHTTLERLYSQTDHRARIAHDPVLAIHRYHAPADQELAGFLAAGLAFGRVDLFLPVIKQMLDIMDAYGGPHRFVLDFGHEQRQAIAPVCYRWVKPGDLGILMAGIQRTLQTYGALESLLIGSERLAVRLDRAILCLREQTHQANDCTTLPRGVTSFLALPSAKSACKRLNLWLRWMTRPATEGVDIGIFRTVQPHELLIPLDVHVGRTARFLGLTRRKDASWRTAQEITDALKCFDPVDPVRFDFALAHLGISGACRGYREPSVCPQCPLNPVCLAPTLHRSP